MTKTHFSRATLATLVLSSPFLLAQDKPSPYQGVSTPPAADAITTTEQAPATPPPAAAPAPAGYQQPAAAPAPATPAIPTRESLKHLCRRRRSALTAAAPAGRNLDAAGDNTDAGIVTYVPGPANALPAGTVFRVRMLQDVNAGSSTPNTPFKGTVTQDIMRNGKVVVPDGSELHGRVVYATAGNRLNGGSVIHLRPDEFVLPDGTRYHLHAQVIDTLGSDTKAKGEGNIVANEHGKRTVAEFALGHRQRSDHWRSGWRRSGRCRGHGRRRRRGHCPLAADQLVSQSAGSIPQWSSA